MRSHRLVVAALIPTLTYTGSTIAAPSTLRVVNTAASPGEPLAVSVTMDGATGIGALDVSISFDPEVLTFVEAAVGPIAANGMLRAGEVSPGKLLIALIDGDGFSDDGEVLQIKFRSSQVAQGKAQLVVDKVTAHDAVKLTAIPTTAENGTVIFAKPSIESSNEIPPPPPEESVSTWIWAPAIAVVFVIGLLLGRRAKPNDTEKVQR